MPVCAYIEPEARDLTLTLSVLFFKDKVPMNLMLSDG